MAKRPGDSAQEAHPPPEKKRARKPRAVPPPPPPEGDAVCIGCRAPLTAHAEGCLYAPGRAMTARRKTLKRRGIDLRTFGAVMQALKERKKPLRL